MINFYNQTFINNSAPDTQQQQQVDSSMDDFFSAIAKTNLILTLFGIIGNIMCICVFFQKPLLSRKFNWYLLILAIAEFFFCCIIFANSIIYVIMPPKMLYDLFIIPCFIAEYVTNTIDAFCVFLTLLLSIDRLNAILDPINSRSFFTNRYPKRIILFSLISLFILKSPDVILAQRRYISDPATLVDNSTSAFKCNITDLTPADLPVCRECDRYNKEAYIIICGIMLPLILNVIPTIAILISNMILSIYVTNYKKKPLIHHHRNHHNASTNNNIQQQRTFKKQPENSNAATAAASAELQKLKSKPSLSVTQKSHHFTIIIIGVWLLFTSAPYYTLNTIIRISSLNIFQQNNKVAISDTGYVYQAILSVFFNSNHCINILIYLIFHKSFRYNSLRLLLKIVKCDNKKGAYFNQNNNFNNKATMYNHSMVAGATTMRLNNNNNNNNNGKLKANNNYLSSNDRACRLADDSLSLTTFNNTETNLHQKRPSVVSADLYLHSDKYKQRLSLDISCSMNNVSRRFSSTSSRMYDNYSNNNSIAAMNDGSNKSGGYLSRFINSIFRRRKSADISTSRISTTRRRSITTPMSINRRPSNGILLKKYDSNEYKLAHLDDSMMNLNSRNNNDNNSRNTNGSNGSKLLATDGSSSLNKNNGVLLSVSSSKLNGINRRRSSKDLKYSVSDCMVQQAFDD